MDKLYKEITSRANIYSTIYAIESFIFEKQLLSKIDLETLTKLKDKYDFDYIQRLIEQCQKRLEKILKNDEFFECVVFLRPKKIIENNSVEFRPLHSSSLIDQICMMSILNALLFKHKFNKKVSSTLAKHIPSNFYGNVITDSADYIYSPWQKKYSEYVDQILNSYGKYLETNEFKHEINLDFIRFFPSLNPKIVVKKVVDILINDYPNKDDKDYVQNLIEKLVFVKVSNGNLVSEYYYGNNKPIVVNNTYFTVGLPQGLPQSYFLSNIIMADLSKIINHVFNGKAFYYVDDSVIFSNINVNSEQDVEKVFSQNLDKLNKDFETYSYDNSKIILLSKELQSIDEFLDKDFFKIELHNQGKSYYAEIDNQNFKMLYIKNLSKWASNTSNDFYTSMNEFEDASILSKVKVIDEAISDELEFLNQEREETIKKIKEYERVKDIQNNEVSELQKKLHALDLYKKRLIRFKKYYAYRKIILTHRETNLIENTQIENFTNNFFKQDEHSKGTDINNFIEKYDEAIFVAELRYYINNIKINFSDAKTNDKVFKSLNNLKNLIKLFEKEILNNAATYGYFTKILSSLEYLKELQQVDEYASLKQMAKSKYNNFSKVKHSIKVEFIKNFSESSESDILERLEEIHLNEANIEMLKYVFRTSNRFTQKMIDCLFSHVFNLNPKETFNAITFAGRSLTYAEFRIIMYIRGKNFSIKKFLSFLNKIKNEENLFFGQVNTEILEVCTIFSKFVKDSDKIDNLIKIHKFVSDIWANGAKFLYFDSLHNQQHAIELIKKSIDITKVFDYFNIKDEDYYILFLACYLHDISMVFYPDIFSFNSDKMQSEIITDDFKKKAEQLRKEGSILKINNKFFKEVLIDCFKKMDNFYESQLRNNHHLTSANFIRNNFDLKFLEACTRDLVANISYSHCKDVVDVYGSKSTAKSSNTSEKYLMIILRLADLLDMSKERISINFMKKNGEFMSDESLFHWITHSIIRECNISSEYEYKCDNKTKTRLENSNFKENVTIKFDVDYCNFVNINNSLPCNGYQCILGNNNPTHEENVINDKMTILFGELCEYKTCNLMCKWMKKKNEYLYEEIKHLTKYLNDSKLNIFNTTIKILYEFENETIDSQYVDKVKSVLEH